MVFESIITDLMNRFLGDFIENLDKKQLNVGIWGGDVVLRNLQLKQSALKELDLPVQTIFGQLGKLVLKIPWKNLYSLPVEADVEDLYLLVAPNSSVTYNDEKQKKIDLDAKKSELARIDEAKKRELEKDKPKADKSFTEKLVAQIINNVQIRIKNVHIRYEDRTTSAVPFSIGITLGSLEVHTTDCDWKRAFLSESLSKVFKLAKLDGLAVYMNCSEKLFQSHLVDEFSKMFLETIATKDQSPANFTYILGPINAVAKLQLNTNPELDDPPFEIPKIDLFLEMEKLAVGITKSQYQHLIELADSMGAMARGIPYRKFRPFGTPYKGNSKIWWKFAYQCVVETEIKRKKREWSWVHMLEHRNLCRTYGDSYKSKVLTKKPSADCIKICEKCEEQLDLFNLVLIRQQIDLEVKKSGKLKEEESQSKGWLSGWWGGKSVTDNDNKDKDILDQFKTAMTPEEKAKLYSAIGYHEGSIVTELPENYVALVMRFKLNMLEICVRNESIKKGADTNVPAITLGNDDEIAVEAINEFNEIDCQTVLSFQIIGVSCEIDQRPAASGLKLDLNMKEFTVFGYKQEDLLPIMVKSKLGAAIDRTLLDVKFEMNPLDKLCDQRITVAARPLQIVYDAETIIQLMNVFKMPQNANLSELTDAATDKISNIKERSATGIQYLVEKHTRLEVNISVMPNYVIIPHGGAYRKDKVPVMVLSLGKLTLKSEPRSGKDVASMHVSGVTSENILKEIMSQAYDKFNLNIQDLQILIAKPYDNWKDVLIKGKITEMHILEPITLYMSADVCVVDDDPRLPKTKVAVKIPTIGVSVTEEKVLDAMSLALSIPLPESDSTTPMPLKESGLIASSLSLKRYLDEKQLQRKSKLSDIKKQELSEEIIQYTDLEFSFILSELSLNIYKAKEEDASPSSQYRTPTEEFLNADETTKIKSISDDTTDIKQESLYSILDQMNLSRKLSFKVKQLEMSMIQRTYDMKVALKLGAISMDHYQNVNSNVITMIETPRYADNSGYLFSLFYTNANKTSPEFTTRYKSVEQSIEINFSILILRLHQEGLSELLQFSNDFQKKVESVAKVKESKSSYRMADAGEPAPLATIAEEPDVVPQKSTTNRKMASIVESIKLQVIANMEQVAIYLDSQKRPLANLKIENLNAGVIMKTSYTEVNVKLQDIIVCDMNPQSIHNTVLSVVGGNALTCQLILYNLDETSVYNSDDMKIDVSMGCVKIVFLNWFVNSILNFLDNFQAAQRAIAEASAAAAEQAKQNMVEAYSNATRMRLNVKIKAPLIIIPGDSQSLNAISLDLGHLHISNVISEIPDSANDRGSAILDEMRLELKDMKLSRVVLYNEEDLQNMTMSKVHGSNSDVVYGLHSDTNILNPTTFALIIKRNLSAGWYKSIPELDVSGRLKSIVVNLLNDDYKMVMSILSKNMAEGADERKVPPVPAPTPVVESALKIPTSTTTPNIINTPSGDQQNEFSSYDETKWAEASQKVMNTNKFTTQLSPLQSPDSQRKIDTFLKFSFQMDSIILNLFSAPDEGLASFGIYFLSLKGHKLVDESLSASIILCDVQLDDTRPDRQNYITKFMKKRETEPVQMEDESKSITSMVDIVARIKGNETFANLKISSFDLILSLEFLLKIAQFMSVPEEDSASGGVKEKPTSANVSSNIQVAKVSKPPVQPPAPVDPNKKVTILIHLEQPDIILVEKMDDINCLALILNTELKLHVLMHGDRQIIRGEIGDLKFYICEFNPSRRNATKHFVLQPCTISLHGTTPEARGMNISLSTSDIRINISPVIIELINKTLTTVMASERKGSQTLNELPDYSDIWNIQSFKDDDFWFMKVDEAVEVLSADEIEQVIEAKPEVCIVEVPSIVIVIETGCGYYTYPMLVIETKMNAEIRDWSTEMSIQSSLSMGMAYYNSALAVWEPLIEPNEREKPNGISEYGPWELNFNLSIEKSQEESFTEEIQPKTKISVSSGDTLEMTVTKTCLDVLQDLGKAFSEAIRPEGLSKPDVIAPFIVENETGYDITLDLKSGDLYLHSSHLPNSDVSHDDPNRSIVYQSTGSGMDLDPSIVTSCKISPGGKAYLQAKIENSLTVISAFGCINKKESKLEEMSLYVQIGDVDKQVILPIHKADRRYFPLYRDTKHDPWGIISHVRTEYGSTIISIHGVLKVRNHFSTPINIYNFQNNNYIEIGQVQPGEDFNVPLHALYADKKDLYFSIAGYKISIQGVNWKEKPSDFKYTKYLQCDPENTYEPFYITAIREREEVYHEVSSKFTMLSACYIINLKPPLYLRNALPIDIHISVAGCTVSHTESNDENAENAVVKATTSMKRGSPIVSQQEDFLDYGEKIVKPGDVLHLPTVKTTIKENESKSFIVARLVQYLEKDWSCTTEIPSIPPEFAVWSFNSYDSVEKMTLELGVRFENRHGSLQLTVYCPFWMINKTGLMLSYRSSDENVNILYHPPEHEGPILFSYREKVFFGKKRASVRVDSGEWSDRFALDAAGSTGVVNCKANDITYEIAVHNTLTHNSLTKQITFMPFYVIMNKAPFPIEVQEDKRPADPWLEIESDKCIPLWPKIAANRMLRVKAVDDLHVSRPFKYTEVQCSLLKMNNKYGGINADVQVTEGGIYVTFLEYHKGDAPALIINQMDCPISFWEKGNVNERKLESYQKMLYTWEDPAGERIIVWNDGDKQVENDLRRDGVNEFKLRNRDENLYWVSFLDGTQRVLLFTNQAYIANEAHSASRLDQVTQIIEIDIRGIGLSLVNNMKHFDIMYIGIASSGVIWEEKKKSKYFKQMKIQEVIMMEDRYQEYLRDRHVGVNDKHYYLDSGKTRVDFESLIIHKSTERAIRRTFYPGMWFQIKSSPYQLQLHAKINRIQIDNQLTDCIFPVVLAPVPPPKSVAATAELKPFIECSIVQRIIPHSDVKQFKYLTMLMQEFHVKVDLVFINEIVEMVSTEISDEESRQQFALDIKRQKEPLSAFVQTHSSQEQKNFYDQLHLGPLKIHISFSMAGLEPGALPPVLSTILQGVGVTLTDINDIVFRLSFFEREYNFFTHRQLQSEIVTHYAGQAVKQAYVLILGLDVIGNPYGLVVGLSKGVEDLFYEPFQGAIQGPGEFAEGLVLGVRSLFGHTVGGAAGAVSKITGAMGKGLAALTFDKDYQKKRREQLNKKPANLQEGLARSSKGLVMGVVDGVTGVFTKPISGAKSDGVEGFFKGLGKGAVGLVARPTAGIVDFASGTFDSVKRAAEMSEDVNRLRSPRFLHADGIVRPFCNREAEGNKLLKEIEKGKYAPTDVFAHYEIIIEKRDVILLTEQRLLYCVKNDLFGGWQVEWTYRWAEISNVRPIERGVEIVIGEKQKKVLGFFGSSEQLKKLILVSQKGKRDKLSSIMESLRVNANTNSS